MLVRFYRLLGGHVALADDRQKTLFVIIGGFVVKTLLIDSKEARKFHHLPGRAQFMLTGRIAHVNSRSLELSARHLARNSALVDQIIELCLIA